MNKKQRTAIVAVILTITLAYLAGRDIVRLNHIDFQWKAYSPTHAYAYQPPPSNRVARPEVESNYSIVHNAPHGDILLRVWQNETQQGKARTNDPTNLQVYCESRGETNEFGYDPQDKRCFKTFKESVEAVSHWFDIMLKNYSLRGALLIYSGNSTGYVDKFMNQ